MFGFYRCFCSLTRWIFWRATSRRCKKSMFSLTGCSNPILSWFGTHRWIFWMFMAVLTCVVLTLAGVSWFSWVRNHRLIVSWFSWLRNHRLIFALFVALAVVVLILAGFFPLRGPPIPCLSLTMRQWFAGNRSIWMTIPFFAFTAAGLVSLAGVHYCRKALWDLRSVTDEELCKGMWRYKRLIRVRVFVWLTYGIATVDFFIIALISIPL
jgi:hypothetical protein